ncbi:Peptide chain release factor PrfB3, chloroplastic [Glycine max]|nr:Peptide chain release factor PrfB3, chloroplastic [Glycine max]
MVMATVGSEPACARTVHDVASSFSSKWQHSSTVKKQPRARILQCSLRIRACSSMANKKDIYKQVGLFSLKRKIEDAVLRAETFASTALEMEEATWIKQEEMVRDFDMWDDPAKSNDILVKLANSAKVVDSLKDLKYKVEEAKLINQLAEINAIDYGLYKQAYETSLDVSEIVDQYEISKLLKGPFDMAGACLVIKAGPKGIYPKKSISIIELEQVNKVSNRLTVYLAQPHSYVSLTIAEFIFKLGCTKSGTGNRKSRNLKIWLWAEQILSMYLRWAKRRGYEGRIVDKCPFKNGGINSAIIEFEFECAYGYLSGEKGVHYLIRGERSHFANKMKALNRLKAKLLVTTKEQGVASIKSIQKENIVNLWQEEIRRYVSHPHKLVHDVKTGVEVPDLNYVLEGNIGPLIAAHINSRVMS